MSHIPENNQWLQDAKVRYKISYTKGQWQVSLVFINTQNPNQFLTQIINSYRSKRLAEICGEHMKNSAARDLRGTQKIDINAYNISYN